MPVTPVTAPFSEVAPGCSQAGGVSRAYTVFASRKQGPLGLCGCPEVPCGIIPARAALAPAALPSSGALHTHGTEEHCYRCYLCNLCYLSNLSVLTVQSVLSVLSMLSICAVLSTCAICVVYAICVICVIYLCHLCYLSVLSVLSVCVICVILYPAGYQSRVWPVVSSAVLRGQKGTKLAAAFLPLSLARWWEDAGTGDVGPVHPVLVWGQ